jgi:hypothetical protein
MSKSKFAKMVDVEEVASKLKPQPEGVAIHTDGDHKFIYFNKPEGFRNDEKNRIGTPEEPYEYMDDDGRLIYRVFVTMGEIQGTDHLSGDGDPVDVWLCRDAKTAEAQLKEIQGMNKTRLTKVQWFKESPELAFASEGEALQYLSDFTGKRIKIAKPLDVLEAINTIRSKDNKDPQQEKIEQVEEKDPKVSKLEASLRELNELVQEAKNEDDFIHLLDRFGRGYYYPIDINRKEFSGQDGKKKFYHLVKEEGIENVPVKM